MTTGPSELVVGIVALNGGELLGRTRLQKTAYLLDHCGMNSNLDFDYRYYGPYSAQLRVGWEVARANGQLNMEELRGRYEMPYTVFRTTRPKPARLGALSGAKAKDLLVRMQSYSDVVLELGATLIYLRDNGYEGNAEIELKDRKPLKATPQRFERAIELLEQLGLGHYVVAMAKRRRIAAA